MALNAAGLRPVVLFSSIHRRAFHSSGHGHDIKIPTYLLCMVKEGKGWVSLSDPEKTATVGQGDCFVLTPGSTVQLMLESESLECFLVLFRPVTLQRRRGNWQAGPLLPGDGGWSGFAGKLEPVRSPALLGDAAALYADSRLPGADSEQLQLRCQSLLCMVLDQLKERSAAVKPSGLELSIGYMQRHFRSKIQLETLAEIAGLTPSSYSRRFKREKGATPVEYLSRLRLHHAKMLLSRPGITVKEAAAESGFGNEFYFSRVFKREVGMAPTAYIKQFKS
ncbi:AraC family transcriptional regulator [Paenibacillus sanfengchensis]|uniref:AraC family transcriptional regulator n=1 Tax=Paenibacillus sanfengchensis TaxID=3119819 RepID=UPI002FE33C6D